MALSDESPSHGLRERVRLARLESRLGERGARLVYTVVNGAVTIGLLAALAHLAQSPFVFPSLGPTAILLFHSPLAAPPRKVLLGHAIGAASGYGSLALFGLVDAGPALADVTIARTGAVALSLALTSGLMIGLRAEHPPAGATTLIVSLGLLAHPWQLAVLMAAVALLTLQAAVIHRLAGVGYPTWASDQRQSTVSR